MIINSNLRRNIFTNRYKILAVIIAIILFLCVIQVLNNIFKTQIEEENKKVLEASNVIQPSYTPEKTLISGDDVPKEEQKENSNIIDSFIKYCNEKEVENAYNLLTEECKEQIFNSSIENFKKNYIEEIFNEKKIYSMQSWITSANMYTYQVHISSDMLATGKVGDKIEDYYTIVRKNNKYKLNINRYIGRININKKSTVKDVTITMLSKDIYKDYEVYNINAKNDSKNTILLDSKQNEKSAYISSEKGATYGSFMYEMDDNLLTITPHLERNISIRFNKIYAPNIHINKITFSDIVTNVEEYNNTQNKEEYKERIKIDVEW